MVIADHPPLFRSQVPLNSQINLLQRTDAAVFAQVDAARADLRKRPVVAVGEREGRLGRTQIERADTLVTQGTQHILPDAIRLPDAQSGERGVGLVEPVVAVAVEGRKVGKAVSGAGAEQFTAVIDAAIAVAMAR